MDGLRKEATRFGRLSVPVVLFVVFVFQSPALGFDLLQWDDELHLVKNTLVNAPDTRTARDHLLTPELGYPIPVTILTYRAEVSVFGLSHPWLFHLTNLVLELLCVWLAMRVGRQLGLSAAGAAVAGLLFALHPVAAEPVSWVSGRKDLLALAFGLISLWLALRSGSGLRRGASVVAYAVGLLAKPAVAPIAGAIVLAELLFKSTTTRSATDDPSTLRSLITRALRIGFPYAVVLAPITYMGVIGQRAKGAIGSAGHQGASQLESIWYALGHHTRLLLMLEEPTAKYIPSPWPPEFEPSVHLMPVVLLVGMLAAYKYTTEARLRVVLFGAAWTVLTYLPASGIFPLSRFLADTYVFFPLLGVGWIAGAVATELDLRLRTKRRIWASVGFGSLLVLGLLFAVSASRFENDIELWAHAFERYPNSARICRQWSNGVARLNGDQAALESVDACIYRFGDELFAKNRAILLARLGRLDEARSAFQRAAQLSPNDPSIQRNLRQIGNAP